MGNSFFDCFYIFEMLPVLSLLKNVLYQLQMQIYLHFAIKIGYGQHAATLLLQKLILGLLKMEQKTRIFVPQEEEVNQVEGLE
jgi:hypothetical protein